MVSMCAFGFVGFSYDFNVMCLDAGIPLTNLRVLFC